MAGRTKASDGVRVFTRDQEDGWARVERALDRAEIPIPLTHRAVWTREGPPDPAGVWLTVENGETPAGARVELHRLRALPGHRALRLRRFGAGFGAEDAALLLGALAELGRTTPRTIRVHVELFDRDPRHLAALAARAAALGYAPDPNGVSYTHTLAVDLTPDEREVFAGLGRRARRGVRAVYKNPTRIRAVSDPGMGKRMAALLAQAYERTGATPDPVPWRDVIRFSHAHPELSRISGLFRTDRQGPEALLGYAWGRHHGDHVDYAVGASTRPPDLSLGIMYGLIWDLMKWAKRTGAVWFDLGGAPAPSDTAGTVLKGITDFKGKFEPELVRVSEPWLFEPRPVRACLARWAGRVTSIGR